MKEYLLNLWEKIKKSSVKCKILLSLLIVLYIGIICVSTIQLDVDATTPGSITNVSHVINIESENKTGNIYTVSVLGDVNGDGEEDAIDLLKYFDDELAINYSNCKNYFDVACKAIDEMYKQVGEAVFENGAAIIEKTYQKDKQVRQYKTNQRKLDYEGFDSRTTKKFEKQAKRTIRKNLTISSVEGIGFGLVGWGIPDIPIFVSVLLKSIYEIAISYGYSYNTDKEKLFILKIIDAALMSGDILLRVVEDI